ncbi:MAG: SDR family oxidoreductase [Ruminiclostridium sp.]|nr:SDR family oxidoreductase [Ruminiclostridium sp.]
MYDLNGKNILIVGASSGIGAGTAKLLASCGAKVILAARREEKLKEICESIGAEKAVWYSADAAANEEIASVVKRIVSEQGKLDGLVYAAGIVEDMPIKNLSHSKLMRTFDVNYFGFIEFVRQVTMRGSFNKDMRIVGISSTASCIGEKAHTSYSASKAAMDASVRCLAKELWQKGIALNTVQPGMTMTDMTQGFIDMQGIESDAYIHTMQRQYGGMCSVEDIANAVAFLISPNARMITGVSLPVDGGALSS